MVVGQGEDGGVIRQKSGDDAQRGGAGQAVDRPHQRLQHAVGQRNEAELAQQRRDRAHQHADRGEIEHRVDQQAVGRVHHRVDGVAKPHFHREKGKNAEKNDGKHKGLHAERFFIDGSGRLFLFVHRRILQQGPRAHACVRADCSSETGRLWHENTVRSASYCICPGANCQSPLNGFRKKAETARAKVRAVCG